MACYDPHPDSWRSVVVLFSGADRFSNDIKLMIGYEPLCSFRLCWRYLTPAVCLVGHWIWTLMTDADWPPAASHLSLCVFRARSASLSSSGLRWPSLTAWRPLDGPQRWAGRWRCPPCLSCRSGPSTDSQTHLEPCNRCTTTAIQAEIEMWPWSTKAVISSIVPLHGNSNCVP